MLFSVVLTHLLNTSHQEKFDYFVIKCYVLISLFCFVFVFILFVVVVFVCLLLCCCSFRKYIINSCICYFVNESCSNKGNNKITELRTILQRESQNS